VVQSFIIVTLPPEDGKDLIYEGIATEIEHLMVQGISDGKDLIYEGIATCLSPAQFR